MEQFGRYQLTRRIGSGGMAEVFLARTQVAQGLSKQLVIKKIHPAFARSRQFAAMFVDEARVSLGLNHPNIVQVFDFGQIGESWYLAMEYVEGLDLLRLEQESARLKIAIPHGLAAYVVQQVAKGLDYAHRKTDDAGEPLGIVHRDVSPQNVLLSLDGAVKLTDFGIARARDVHEEEGVVKGKFAYMAPEQARGELVDRRADVFSLGVVLFELVTGRPLYSGKGKEVLEKVKAGGVPRPRTIKPTIEPALEEIILRALTFHRDDRYQTGRDLQNALGRFQFEFSRESGAPIDSGALAQFVAGLGAPTGRPGQARPPSALPVGGPPRGERPLEGGGGEPTREHRERKHVFVVEGHVTGVAGLERRLGRRDAARVLEEFQNLARELAYKHDAYVHRSEDAALTLVVGLPVAGEDDASRAIRLALGLVEALDGIGLDLEPDLRLAVGIQRGVALVRRRRGVRFGYELSGATTGIARRLANEASGGDVLVGGAVYRVARDEWNFEELATIDLGGTDASTPQPELPTDTDTGTSATRARVYRLRGAKGRAQRVRDRQTAGSLLSREHELQFLRDAYRNVQTARRHRHVLVTGDEGVGKRSLVNAFVDGIPRLEATVVRAVARVATAGTPLGVFADLVRDLFGLPENADPREVTRRIDKVIEILDPGGAEEHGPTMRRAVSIVLGLERQTGEAAGEERRAVLRQAAALAERHFGGGVPLVLVVEDVHWADEQSLQLFEDLLALPETRGLLAIMTSRHDPRVVALAGRARSDILRLDELDKPGRIQFLARRFAADEDIKELARHILARTGGNPFFINEMLESLVDRGILKPDVDGPHAGKLRWIRRDAPLTAPTTVEALLAARIDQLPALEKEALIHAAVLGRRFELGTLEALLGKPIADPVARLIDRRMLERDEGWYAFKNELTMTVAYGMVPEEERREMHKAAAERMTAAPGYRAGRDDEAIGRHLELAGDLAAAAERYLRGAGHQADVGSSADAFRTLSRVLKLLAPTDHERRFTARCLREVILRRLARRPAQLREIDGIRKEAEALGDPARLAQAHARLAQFYVDVRKLPAALKAAAPAMQYAREAGDKLAEADALRLRAEIARLGGQGAEALRLTEQALALCGEGDREVQSQRATILSTRGVTLWSMGRLREAVEVYLETLVIYRALGLPRLEARSLNNLGVVFSTLGEPEQALAYYKSSLKLDQELGDRAAMALKLGNIGQCYADLGDLDKGERYLGKALELAEELDDHAIMADLQISIGQVLAERGRMDEAARRYEDGLARAVEIGDRYQEVRGLTYLALTEVERGGDAEAALAWVTAAAEKAQAAAMPVGEIFALAAQGVALVRLGRAAEGAEKSAQAVAMQVAREQPEGAEQIPYLHAQVLEAAGQLDAAREALGRAWAEVEAKASRLSDELRATYLAAKVPAAIAAARARLGVA